MKTLLLLVALGNAADTASSLAAFSQGATEANPFVISTRPIPFITQAALWTAGELWALERLDRAGHPKLARALSHMQIGASLGLTGWNMGLAYSLKQQKGRD